MESRKNGEEGEKFGWIRPFSSVDDSCIIFSSEASLFVSLLSFFLGEAVFFLGDCIFVFFAFGPFVDAFEGLSSVVTK